MGPRMGKEGLQCERAAAREGGGVVDGCMFGMAGMAGRCKPSRKNTCSSGVTPQEPMPVDMEIKSDPTLTAPAVDGGSLSPTLLELPYPRDPRKAAPQQRT